MKIIILLITCTIYLSAYDAHEKYKEILHPTPILQKQKEVPVYMLRDIPTPTPSNFENVNAIIEEEEGNPAQNESSIAVNPVNPKQLISAAVDYRSESDRWVYLSSDGGRSWTNQNLGKARDNWRSSNDPSVAFAWDGWAYLMYGAFPTSRGVNGIYISITTDFGETWESHIPVIENLNSEDEDMPFDDKYYIELDNSEQSPYQGYVYTPWKRMVFTDNSTQIMVARSTDRGFTWEEPVPISPRKPDTVDDTTYGQSFPLLTTGKNGELYAVWNDGLVHGVGFNRSYDGGLTWEEPRIVQNYEIFGETRQVNGTWQHRIKDNVRAETYPVIKCDRTDGEGSGNLYLTWAGGEPPNIYFSKSEDEGDTWTEPVMIHADTVGNDQWWQWLDIDPVTGDLAIMFMDSRNDPNNIWAETWVAYSSNQGETWIERQVSDVRSDLRRNPFANNVFAGDYNGCAFYNGIIYPSWVDMRNTEIGGADNDVYAGYVDINAPATPKAEITELFNRADELVIEWETNFQNSFFLNEIDAEDLELRAYVNGSEDYILLDPTKGIDTLRNLELFTKIPIELRIYDKNKDKESGTTFLEGTPGIIKDALAPEIISYNQDQNGMDFIVKTPEFKIDGLTPIPGIELTNLYIDGELIYFFDQNVGTGAEIPLGYNPTEDGYYLASFDSEIKYASPNDFRHLSEQSNIFVWFGEPKTNDLLDFDTEALTKEYDTDSWEITESFSKSGGFSITDSKGSNYANDSENYLLLPQFKRNDNDDPIELNFWHAAIIGFGDKGIIEISTDLEEWNSIAEYNEDDFEPWKDGTLDDNDWKRESISVSEFVEPGEKFYIRFVLEANAFVDNDGWYLDEFYVQNAPLSVDRQETKLEIYPNPANDKLHLNQGRSYRIYDIFGNLVIEGNRNSKATFIDISKLTPGSYFVETEGLTAKFIKL